MESGAEAGIRAAREVRRAATGRRKKRWPVVAGGVTGAHAAKSVSCSRYWYRCLRALGIRVRGIYTTKDTFVTTALRSGVKIAWLEQQTGVAYATLKRHYGKWMPREGESELRRFHSARRGT